MRSSLVATFAAACLALGAPTASATPRETVGGPLLATDGVTVSPLAGAPALPAGLGMGSWLVADADTGAVLAAKAPHRRFLPASTLQTLTAVPPPASAGPPSETSATQPDAPR